MSKKVKVFAIVVLILAFIIGAVSYFGDSSSSTTSVDNALNSSVSKAGGLTSDSTVSEPVSEFATLLSTINGISIDTDLFNDPAYRALRDYPITLGSDIQGRPNPFAPVGNDSGLISGSVSVTQVQFETIQPNKITSTTAEFGAQALVSNTDQATVVFEYGLNDILGSATAPIPLSKNGTALFRVSGLSPATTYYVRAVLAQGSNTTPGNIMTFVTGPSR